MIKNVTYSNLTTLSSNLKTVFESDYPLGVRNGYNVRNGEPDVITLVYVISFEYLVDFCSIQVFWSVDYEFDKNFSKKNFFLNVMLLLIKSIIQKSTKKLKIFRISKFLIVTFVKQLKLYINPKFEKKVMIIVRVHSFFVVKSIF